MALVGRRPGREQLARSRQKPVTVAQALRRLGLVGRWASATGHGLPTEWTSATVDAFVVAYHASTGRRIGVGSWCRQGSVTITCS
jgi:hypothetical protein